MTETFYPDRVHIQPQLLEDAVPYGVGPQPLFQPRLDYSALGLAKRRAVGAGVFAHGHTLAVDPWRGVVALGGGNSGGLAP